MKMPVSSAINEFISDFDLLNSNDGISFNARILFLENSIPNFYTCKAFIVPVKDKPMDAIYFLDAQIKSDGFEDYFALDNSRITYVKKESLQLHINPSTEVYIFPLDQRLQNTKNIQAKPGNGNAASVTSFSGLLRDQQVRKELTHFKRISIADAS